MSALRAVQVGETPSAEPATAPLTIADLKLRGTISLPEAARVLGIGKNLAYEAARRGEIPTLQLGHRLVVPCRPLLRLLGVDEA